MRTLNILITDELYNSLKHRISGRRISQFVSEAVTEKLLKEEDKLYKAYLEASQDKRREEQLRDWNQIS